MLTLVQLEDGCYLLTLDVRIGGVMLHRRWVFALAESDAKPIEGGETIRLQFGDEFVGK